MVTVTIIWSHIVKNSRTVISYYMLASQYTHISLGQTRIVQQEPEAKRIYKIVRQIYCTQEFYQVLFVVATTSYKDYVTNFIQLVSPQPVDRFSQTKLRWEALNESYSHICGMHKSNNKRLRYQAISSCKSFVC